MLTQTEAYIYLAGSRRLQQDSGFRRYSNFESTAYDSLGRSSFGNLYALNDETLAGGASCFMDVAESSLIYIIPVVGKLEYHAQDNEPVVVEAGSCKQMHLSSGSRFEIRNPYDEELINYLQICFRDSLYNGDSHAQVFDFDIDAQRNRLLTISQMDTIDLPRISLGKFAGRSEAVYLPGNDNRGLFCFVLEGAFEVANRLLEGRDGLALKNAGEVEFEALSNDAILLMIEVCLLKTS